MNVTRIYTPMSNIYLGELAYYYTYISTSVVYAFPTAYIIQKTPSRRLPVYTADEFQNTTWKLINTKVRSLSVKARKTYANFQTNGQQRNHILAINRLFTLHLWQYEKNCAPSPHSVYTIYTRTLFYVNRRLASYTVNRDLVCVRLLRGHVTSTSHDTGKMFTRRSPCTYVLQASKYANQITNTFNFFNT